MATRYDTARDVMQAILAVLIVFFTFATAAPILEDWLKIKMPDFVATYLIPKPDLQWAQSRRCSSTEVDNKLCAEDGRILGKSERVKPKETVLAVVQRCIWTHGYLADPCRILKRTYPHMNQFYLFAFVWALSIFLTAMHVVYLLWNIRAFFSALLSWLKRYWAKNVAVKPFPRAPRAFVDFKSFIDLFFVVFATYIWSQYAEYLAEVDNSGLPTPEFSYNISNIEQIYMFATFYVVLFFSILTWRFWMSLNPKTKSSP